MAYDGNGTFNLIVGNPIASGSVSNSTLFNNTNQDLANGLTNALTRDGQAPPTANIPMGSFKFTGLAAGTTAGDSVRYEQVFTSPAFTGTPTAPTAALGTNTTQIATTAFVAGTAFSSALPAQTGNSGKLVTTNGTTASWSLIGTSNQLLKVNAAGTALEGSLIGTALQFIRVNAGGTALEGYTLNINPQWSIITANPGPAVAGGAYQCNTNGAAFTVTLPAAPSANDVIRIADYAGTFATNNLTIGRNGLKIMGLAEDMVISTNNVSITLVYIDATQGWRIV